MIAFFLVGDEEAFLTIYAGFFFGLFKASMTSRRDTLVAFLVDADLSGSTLPFDTLREAGCLEVLLFWRNRLETAEAFFTVVATRYLELLCLRDAEERSSFLLLSWERLALLSLSFFSLALAWADFDGVDEDLVGVFFLAVAERMLSFKLAFLRARLFFCVAEQI